MSLQTSKWDRSSFLVKSEPSATNSEHLTQDPGKRQSSDAISWEKGDFVIAAKFEAKISAPRCLKSSAMSIDSISPLYVISICLIITTVVFFLWGLNVSNAISRS